MNAQAGMGERGQRRKLLSEAQALTSGERALVEGRYPGSDGAVVFDETAAEEEPSGGKRRSAERQGRAGLSWRRVPEAELHARRAVDKAVTGKHSAEERSIEAPPDPCGARDIRSNSRLRPRGAVHAGCSEVEAGGSPSSELHPKIRALERRGAERSRGGKDAIRGNRATYRVLVS